MRNRKGLTPIVILTFIAITMIVVYLLLYLPIPAFKNFRATINYFLIIALWFVLQAFVVFAYIKLGQLAIKGIRILKTKVLKWNTQLERYIVFKT